MKFNYLVYIFCVFFSIQSYSQISQNGVPLSKSLANLKAKVNLPKSSFAKLDTIKLGEEDAEFPTPLRYSIINEVNINIKKGLQTELPENKGKIWRYVLDADQSKSIQVYFSKFTIPEGASLFLYSSDYSIIKGAFTSANMQADSSFIVADFPNNSVIIEYFEPSNALFEGRVVIGKVGQAYRNIFNNELSSNYININCEQGANWQDVKHAVCRITFQEGRNGYLCTGTLLNNTQQDQTPYFLTANHCLNTSTVASTLVAYFNYENEGCSGLQKQQQTISGAELLNTSNLSDYTLLKLNNIPPATYQPYFAGWDVSGESQLGAVGIHHPEGLTKKIAISTDSVIPNNSKLSWNGGTDSPASSHWKLIFTEGKTNEGSSGSALFDKQKRVIGQLHGGNDLYDFYGRLSYSWNVGQTGMKTIKQYLDPNNTGITILNSYIPTSNKPSAFFELPSSTVCKDAGIQFTDKSVFSATSWKWEFTPSSISYLNGTTANSQNPLVSFNEATSYSVKLISTNENGSDSMSFINAISAGNTIQLVATSTPINEICFCKFDSVLFKASGATEYIWSFANTENRVNIKPGTTNTAIAKLVDNVDVSNTFSFTVQLIGKQGTCSDTIKIPYSVIKPLNDNVQHATTLTMGKSSEFSNKCATIEKNEPQPPYRSCTSQFSWCDEYGTGLNIIENSLWFKFIAPQSGIIGIASEGMDNELALYDANSYNDILLGKAVLLAANDDATANSSNPIITSATVVPGKEYWLQVDGSGGGTVGSFTLTLSDTKLATDLLENSKTTENEIKIYPQPVNEELTITGLGKLSGNILFNFYAMTGKLALSKSLSMNNIDFTKFNLSDFKPGIYLLRIIAQKQIYTIQFIKK